jgi:hypothetical protein
MMAVGKFGRLFSYMAILGVVAVIAIAIFLVTSYHQATKIDRTVPKVVVREYIDAALVRRDAGREELFVCKNPTGLGPIADLRSELKAEESAGVTTQIVLTSALEVGDGSKVDAILQLNQGSGLHVDRRTQHWIFELKDEDGWRVCAAQQIPDPIPSTQPTTS